MSEDPSSEKLVLKEQPINLGRGFLTRYWDDEQTSSRLTRFERFSYYFRKAIGNILSLPLSNAISVMTVALSLFLLGGFILVLQNLDEILTRAGNSQSITVYLKDDIGQKDLSDFVREMENNRSMLQVDYISRDQALKLFKTDLGDQSGFLKGLEKQNPLPASVELRLRPDSLGVNGVARVAEKLKKRPFVSDVVFGSEWVEHVDGVLKLFRGLGFTTIFILFSVIVFLIANTIRLVVFSREREIEIMRLVGATKNFVQIPFVIGGAIQGFLGSALGLLLLLGVFLLFTREVYSIQELHMAFPALSFLSTASIFTLLFGGTIVGGIGSYFAVSRVVNV